MITRHAVKSCCGASSLIFETDKPIRKSQVQVFKDSGYLVPESYLNLGIFYVQKQTLIATASFGANKITVRCKGKGCAEQLDELALLMEQAINTK